MVSPSINLSRNLLLVLLVSLASAEANLNTQKIQIRVPQTVQYHHHTHTKHHIITVPVRMNETTTQRPNVIAMMPIFPLVNGTLQTPGLPGVGIQTNALFPQPGGQFGPQQGGQFGPQQGQFGPQQGGQFMPQQGQFEPQQGQGGNNFLNNGFQGQPLPQNNGNGNFQQGGQFFNQNAGFQGQPSQWLPMSRPYQHHYSNYDDSDHEDSAPQQKVLKVEVTPNPTTQPPMKFKTIINVHETKKIPLMDYLNLNNLKNLLLPEKPQRIKIEVPEKTSYIRQQQRTLTSSPTIDWDEIQNTLNAAGQSYNPETASYGYQSTRHEDLTPHWLKVKQLLEQQINDDFPNLKVNAELTPLVNSPSSSFPLEKKHDEEKSQVTDLTHIGYLVVDNNNQHRFVSLGEAKNR